RDWLRVVGSAPDESDMDKDGETDRTWTLVAIAGASGPEGQALYARWSAGAVARSAAVAAGAVTAVDARPDELSIRALTSPAVGRARFTYAIPTAGWTRLHLFDLGGRVVATLVDGVTEAGTHSAEFVPARDHASQVLFYELEWNGQHRRGSIALVR